MNALKLLVGVAACAAAIPVIAASDNARQDAKHEAKAANEKVALATAPAANKHVSRSTTDLPARKYPEAGKSQKLVHERWVRDEDHLY